MPRVVALLSVLVVALLVPAASALAGSAIDTTGFATNTEFPFTSNSGPPFFDTSGSEAAQTFVAPAGAQSITRVGVLAAASADQPVTLKLYALSGGAPGTELKSESVTVASGSRSLRSYDVAWPVVGGTGYAFAFGAAPDVVTGNTSLTLPNIGGADGRNVYPDGNVFTRPLLAPPVPQAWNGDTAIDIKFRLDFDGGVTTGGGGDGGGGTTPPVTTPAATPQTGSEPGGATPAAPALPAKALAVKAVKGAKGVPASLTCTGAALSSCSLTVTPPKGARSVRVDILRGAKVIASGASSKAKAGTGKRRVIRLSAKGALAAGRHTVRLTIVTAKGRTLRQTATFTA